MEFVRGNRAIRDHVQDGKELLLFESLGKSNGYRYLGAFQCSSWEERRGPDLEGKDRKLIVFHLVEIAAPSSEIPLAPENTENVSLAELRERAISAAKTSSRIMAKDSRRIYRERSIAVKVYVLKRADGICEACEAPAPFIRTDGSPYLEAHHTRRIADDGPDDPEWVGGICPTCHRRIHHAADGNEWNLQLQNRIKLKEAELSNGNGK